MLNRLILGLSALLLVASAAWAKDNENTVGGRGNSYSNSSPNGNASVNGSLQSAKKALQEYKREPTDDNWSVANESALNAEENAGTISSERPLQGSGWRNRLDRIWDGIPAQ
jgi:hypothetical protein